MLIDAPCATDKHIILSTDETVRREMPRLESGYYPSLQLELLRAGLRALRPGGTLVYCTCTLDSRQNSAVVEAALSEIDPSHEARGVRYSAVPLFGSFRDGGLADQDFNLVADDLGVLVVPSKERNWGPMCKNTSNTRRAI